MSALLEQLPHSGPHSTFSRRFETIRDFLTKVVSVVPIESLVHAISAADRYDTALLCCQQLMSLPLTLPKSLTMASSLNRAVHQMGIDSKVRSTGSYSDGTRPRYNPKSARDVKECADKSLINLFIVDRQLRRQYELKHRISDPMKNAIARANRAAMHSVVDNKLYDLGVELQYLFELLQLHAKSGTAVIICNISLVAAYPLIIDDPKARKGPLNSPIQILRDGRGKIRRLVELSAKAKISQSSEESQSSQRLTQLYNSKMLKVVNEIRKNEVEICSLLLGAFMEEQIKVPLMKTSFDTARAIEIATSAAALGVWALYSLTFGDVQAIIGSIPSKSLLVEVKDYIKGVFKQETVSADENYAGKLQFMVQGMKETVSCNSHYVSYSLERQLIELCKTLKIDETTPLEVLISNWDEIFKDNVMSLVVPMYRSLIARWLKWALMVHHLREELAHYTAVGVVGLVNSGKSSLVGTLFNVKVGRIVVNSWKRLVIICDHLQIPVGTTAAKRTTVPFLYNMDGVVDGLDVIDFPGVDDRDETISELAELLLSIAQVVVFVVDYRSVTAQTKSL